MANPSVQTLTADTWTKVATNILKGVFHRMDTNIKFLQTYRLTGNPAPTNDNDAIRVFQNSNTERIEYDYNIDIYYKALDSDGRIRVDIA